MTIEEIGSLIFGVVVGYITYRTLSRTVEKAAISDLSAVVATIGGGAVAKLYTKDSRLFAWYAIGLAAGMVIWFVVLLATRQVRTAARKEFP
jgi:bacteriorhodopsin